MKRFLNCLRVVWDTLVLSSLVVCVVSMLSGCVNVFDSEDAKIAELERVAYNNRQFDRAGIKIDYVFANRNAPTRLG